jgi:rSAM/selenodomain-associated transferase 2
MINDVAFSFIIPTLNEQQWLGATLQALTAASRKADQILVCDGGSTDATLRIARENRSVTLIESQRGRARQLNAALGEATGEIVVFIHADTLISPDILSEARRAIDRGRVGGWFPVELLFRPNGTYEALALKVIQYGINWRTRQFKTATGEQCLFARRDVLEKLGGVPSVQILEGAELAKRLRQCGQIHIGHSKVRTSSRRWLKNGPLRTSLLMHSIRLGYELGVPPETLTAIWREFNPGD